MSKELKVGGEYEISSGYEDSINVIITAIGVQNLMYVTNPMCYFNGILEEKRMRIDKFKEIIIGSK